MGRSERTDLEGDNVQEINPLLNNRMQYHPYAKFPWGIWGRCDTSEEVKYHRKSLKYKILEMITLPNSRCVTPKPLEIYDGCI